MSAVVASVARIDWPAVLLRLRAAGFSDAALAERLDIPKSTLAGYRILGAEPPWSNGQRIVALWCECTGSWPEALPTVDGRPPK